MVFWRVIPVKERENMAIKIGIIGGGAAGMMAAITAAGQGANVTLLEGNDRLGKKILSTGNGKCNLGNEKLDMEEYYTSAPDFLEKSLQRFSTDDTIDFFRGLGLLIKSKNGYLYPAGEQAAIVLDVLRFEVEAKGVHIVTECKVDKIESIGQNSYASPKNAEAWKKTSSLETEIVKGNTLETGNQRGGFTVIGGGKQYHFDKIIIACGGQAAPKTGSDGSGYKLAKKLGHSLIPTVPALVQLRCREDYLKNVAGVRADALIKVLAQGEIVAVERGELQLTDYGISGIPVFQLSRIVNYMLMEKKEVAVAIDFLPDFDESSYEQLQIGRTLLQGQRTVEEYFTGMLNKKLMLQFIRMAGLKPTEEIAAAEPAKIKRVYALCRNWTVHVTGSNTYDNAQVCAGGVPLEELTEDMESRKTPGVYFAGEILDVDGKCGGYNLQWAWCSGYLAGMAAAKRK